MFLVVRKIKFIFSVEVVTKVNGLMQYEEENPIYINGND